MLEKLTYAKRFLDLSLCLVDEDNEIKYASVVLENERK